MSKIIKTMLLSALFVLGLQANDLLSKATGGSINDNTFGVKELSSIEMKDIKGGYILYGVVTFSPTSVGMFAIPDDDTELGLVYNGPKIDFEKSELRSRGLCGLGVTECYLNKQTQTHSEISKNRLIQYYQAMGSTYNLIDYALVYIMERKIRTTPGGINYRGNVARLGAYNYHTKTVHSVNYDLALQYNPIVKEIQQAADKLLVDRLDKLATTMR